MSKCGLSEGAMKSVRKVTEKCSVTSPEPFKEELIYAFDILKSDFLEKSPLAYHLMTSNLFIVGLTVEHPEQRTYLVPTDRFWKMFGLKEGQEVLQKLKERSQWQDSQTITEEQVRSINQVLRRRVN